MMGGKASRRGWAANRMGKYQTGEAAWRVKEDGLQGDEAELPGENTGQRVVRLHK